jgi:hypothetical protein
MTPIRILLSHAIDYAGLFPPAGLTMKDAVQNYAAYLTDENTWALGRFIVPVSRLTEFESAASDLRPADTPSVWRLSALAGTDMHDDVSKILRFNERQSGPTGRGRATIDTIEIKVSESKDIRNAMSAIPRTITAYFEIPIITHPAPLLAVIGESGARAKVRTGGITRDAFPRSFCLARFILACTKAGVAFKATAGLHHAIRSVYPLTYEKDSQPGMMHGFLNVFLAAAFSRTGIDADIIVRLLEEESSSAFRFTGDGIEWNRYCVDSNGLRALREHGAISFGSCSFVEPIDTLKAIHLL